MFEPDNNILFNNEKYLIFIKYEKNKEKENILKVEKTEEEIL